MNTAKFSLYIQYNNVVSRTTCGIMCSVYPINRIYLMCINALYNVCPQRFLSAYLDKYSSEGYLYGNI